MVDLYKSGGSLVKSAGSLAIAQDCCCGACGTQSCPSLEALEGRTVTLEISGFEYESTECIAQCADEELWWWPLNGTYTMTFQPLTTIFGNDCGICTDEDTKTHQCTPNDATDGYFFSVYLYCVEGNPVELGIYANLSSGTPCSSRLGNGAFETVDPSDIADFLACAEVTGEMSLACGCEVDCTIAFSLQLTGC